MRVATGVGTQGQGHYTVFAQIVADALAVDVEDVQVITGDTREFQWGTGTFASRGAVVAGSACHAAAHAVREKILALASQLLRRPAGSDLQLAAVASRFAMTTARGLALASLRQRRIRCAARCGRAPSRVSRAPRTSVPIAAARRAACTR